MKVVQLSSWRTCTTSTVSGRSQLKQKKQLVDEDEDMGQTDEASLDSCADPLVTLSLPYCNLSKRDARTIGSTDAPFRPLICVAHPHKISLFGSRAEKAQGNDQSEDFGVSARGKQRKRLSLVTSEEDEFRWDSALGPANAFFQSSNPKRQSASKTNINVRIAAIHEPNAGVVVAMQNYNSTLRIRDSDAGGNSDGENGSVDVNLPLPALSMTVVADENGNSSVGASAPTKSFRVMGVLVDFSPYLVKLEVEHPSTPTVSGYGKKDNEREQKRQRREKGDTAKRKLIRVISSTTSTKNNNMGSQLSEDKGEEQHLLSAVLPSLDSKLSQDGMGKVNSEQLVVVSWGPTITTPNQSEAGNRSSDDLVTNGLKIRRFNVSKIHSQAAAPLVAIDLRVDNRCGNSYNEKDVKSGASYCVQSVDLLDARKGIVFVVTQSPKYEKRGENGTKAETGNVWYGHLVSAFDGKAIREPFVLYSGPSVIDVMGDSSSERTKKRGFVLSAKPVSPRHVAVVMPDTKFAGQKVGSTSGRQLVVLDVRYGNGGRGEHGVVVAKVERLHDIFKQTSSANVGQRHNEETQRGLINVASSCPVSNGLALVMTDTDEGHNGSGGDVLGIAYTSLRFQDSSNTQSPTLADALASSLQADTLEPCSNGQSFSRHQLQDETFLDLKMSVALRSDSGVASINRTVSSKLSRIQYHVDMMMRCAYNQFNGVKRSLSADHAKMEEENVTLDFLFDAAVEELVPDSEVEADKSNEELIDGNKGGEGKHRINGKVKNGIISTKQGERPRKAGVRGDDPDALMLSRLPKQLVRGACEASIVVLSQKLLKSPSCLKTPLKITMNGCSGPYTLSKKRVRSTDEISSLSSPAAQMRGATKVLSKSLSSGLVSLHDLNEMCSSFGKAFFLEIGRFVDLLVRCEAVGVMYEVLTHCPDVEELDLVIVLRYMLCAVKNEKLIDFYSSYTFRLKKREKGRGYANNTSGRNRTQAGKLNENTPGLLMEKIVEVSGVLRNANTNMKKMQAEHYKPPAKVDSELARPHKQKNGVHHKVNGLHDGGCTMQKHGSAATSAEENENHQRSLMHVIDSSKKQLLYYSAIFWSYLVLTYSPANETLLRNALMKGLGRSGKAVPTAAYRTTFMNEAECILLSLTCLLKAQFSSEILKTQESSVVTTKRSELVSNVKWISAVVDVMQVHSFKVSKRSPSTVAGKSKISVIDKLTGLLSSSMSSSSGLGAQISLVDLLTEHSADECLSATAKILPQSSLRSSTGNGSMLMLDDNGAIPEYSVEHLQF